VNTMTAVRMTTTACTMDGCGRPRRPPPSRTSRNEPLNPAPLSNYQERYPFTRALQVQVIFGRSLCPAKNVVHFIKVSPGCVDWAGTSIGKDDLCAFAEAHVNPGPQILKPKHWEAPGSPQVQNRTSEYSQCRTRLASAQSMMFSQRQLSCAARHRADQRAVRCKVRNHRDCVSATRGVKAGIPA